MASFLLVHGSWHGAWCWSRLVPLLEARGHQVTAIDLPGHGADRTAAHRITLRAYSRSVQDAAAQCQSPPILVGHSMGGMVITRAAAASAELFAGIVYLCAFVPRRGDSVIRLGRMDRQSLVPVGAVPRPPRIKIRKERAREIFYGACTDEAAEWAISQLRPDPLWPLLQRLSRNPTTALFRAYVECTEDRAITIASQRAMLERSPCDEVVSMKTDHSPFLSAPGELAEHLDALAGQVGRA